MTTAISSTNPAVDAYIAKAQPFARPILTHLRDLAHQAVPSIEEEMKWSRPFFMLNGIVLCNISAFKQHCSLGFWGPEMQQLLAQDGFLSSEAMGSFGRLIALNKLPPDKVLLHYFKQAAALIQTGERTRSINRPAKAAQAAKPDVAIPEELAAALKKNKTAQKVFTAFAPSCQREYTEWIADAKRPETRDRRIEQAITWIAEGKQRNWKYQAC